MRRLTFLKAGSMNNPEYIIVHCFATPPSMKKLDAAWVDKTHRRRGFFNGNGYQEIIKRGGERQNYRTGHLTRRLDQSGAHVGGCGTEWNSKTIGISMAGGVDAKGNPENNFTKAQFKSLLEAIREYQAEFNIPDSKVIGHRDLIKMTGASPKACPCFSVQNWLTGQPFGGSYKHPGKFDREDPLHVPEKHTIKRGDTLWSIARITGVPVKSLETLNPEVTAKDLQVGQVIRVL